MTPSRSLPLLALATLVACSSASTPTPTPPPAPSASASAASEPGPGWSPHDPRIVRCGVDDRPRNVVSRLSDDEPARSPRLKRAPPVPVPVPTPVPPPPPPVPLPKPTPDGFVLTDRAVPFEPPLAPAAPPLRIEALPLTSPSGGPVPAITPSADPHYEICSSLAAPDEVPGPLTFGLELASSGAPLRVLPPPGSGTPTPLVRCLMERACQLQASAPGQKTLLDVPLRVSRDQPVSPPAPAEAVRVDVASENPRPDLAELQLQLRSAVASVMQTCGPVPGRARVRLSLDLVTPGRRPPVRRSRNLRIMMPPPAETTITGQRTEALEGTVSSAVLGCVVNGIRQRSFAQVLSGPRTERLLLTWNP